MRDLAIAATLLGPALLGTALLGATPASAQTTLIFGEAGPNRGARADATQWFADEVEARSGGDLRIDIQWGGALFKAEAAAQGIRDGVADMGTIIAVYYPQEMAGYGIADLPVENPDAWVGMRAVDELMRGSDVLQQDLADKNLVYLGTFTTSSVNIGCKGAAIRETADIDGLKVRGVGAYGDAFGDLGASLVNMSIYDAYQGLDSGLIDCSQGYSYAVSALKQGEVMDSYTLLDWGQVGGLGIFMNADAHAMLSLEHQAMLAEVGSEMADEFGRMINEANDAAVEEMRGQGVEIIELDPAERAALIARGEPFIEEWAETAASIGLPAEDLLGAYRGLIVKYTEERDAQGYPWER